MRFYKFISVILHPIVIPTIGILLYFLFIPNPIQEQQRFLLLGLIFITTYLIPLLILILLKSLNLISSFQVNTVKERKIPLLLMILLFYLIANALGKFSLLKDISLLFYATSFGLVAVYILFILKIKTSLHMLSMGVFLGFFLVLSNNYSVSLFPLLIVLILLSGLLASARLYLKAHTPKEVYLGFLLGIFTQIITFYFL